MLSASCRGPIPGDKFPDEPTSNVPHLQSLNSPCTILRIRSVHCIVLSQTALQKNGDSRSAAGSLCDSHTSCGSFLRHETSAACLQKMILISPEVLILYELDNCQLRLDFECFQNDSTPSSGKFNLILCVAPSLARNF